MTSAYFRDVIEPLCDSFDPADVQRYVDLFTQAIGRPEFREHYKQIRESKPFDAPPPADVFVLSRVTLGADVAITSVVLDAMIRRFPEARLWFAGPRKNYELFERSPRIQHADLPYRRGGSLAERLAASAQLAQIVDHPRAIVVDPDSRLTQLGLIPVCAPERYYFFDTRSITGAGSLGELTKRWVADIFGVPDARAFIAPKPPDRPGAEICVSLGVGENPDKRIPDSSFERDVLLRIAARGRSILVDTGAGGEEADRVHHAIRGIPNARPWQGSFASFAAQIARASLYVGYDSSGQHVAAACGVPLITIFAGYPNERFLERWRPSGPGRIDVVRVDIRENPARILERVAHLLPRP